MKKRILWIDVMRAVCALYIVGFWHLGGVLYSPLPENNFTFQTTYCVLATFTLISGFFAANNHLNNIKDIIMYYFKKLIRIYPLFTLAGVMFIIIGYSSRGIFILCQLGLGVLYPPMTLWYVCMVLVFYFLAPFVLRRKSIWGSVFVFILFEVVLYILNRRFGVDERLYYYWIFFYMGLEIKKNNLHTLINRNYILTVFSLLVYFVTSLIIGQELNKFTIICAMSFIYSIASITCFLFGKQETNKVIEFISYSSMCAYLFHRPIYYYLHMIHGPFSLIMAYLICIPTVFILSWLIQKTYDSFISCLKKEIKHLRK